MPRAGATNYLANEAQRLNVDAPMPSAGPSGSPSSSGPLVYVHYKETQQNLDPITGAPRPYSVPREVRQGSYVDPSVLMAQFDGWSQKRKMAMARRLARGGFIPVDPYVDETLSEYLGRVSLQDVRRGYQNLLTQAVEAYATDPNTKLGPQRLLSQAIEFNRGKLFGDGDDDAAGGSGSSSKRKPYKHPLANKTVTEKTTTRDIYSPADAEALARAVVEQELGRVPTEEEYADFVSALNAVQQENPHVTRTRTHYDKHGRVETTNTRSRGGMSSSAVQAFATEWAEDQPGAAEWQAIGTYYPALLQALGAVVPGA